MCQAAVAPFLVELLLLLLLLLLPLPVLVLVLVAVAVTVAVSALLVRASATLQRFRGLLTATRL